MRDRARPLRAPARAAGQRPGAGSGGARVVDAHGRARSRSSSRPRPARRAAAGARRRPTCGCRTSAPAVASAHGTGRVKSHGARVVVDRRAVELDAGAPDAAGVGGVERRRPGAPRSQRAARARARRARAPSCGGAGSSRSTRTSRSAMKPRWRTSRRQRGDVQRSERLDPPRSRARAAPGGSTGRPWSRSARRTTARRRASRRARPRSSPGCVTSLASKSMPGRSSCPAGASNTSAAAAPAGAWPGPATLRTTIPSPDAGPRDVDARRPGRRRTPSRTATAPTRVQRRSRCRSRR